MKTAQGLVEWAKKAYLNGWVYWWGTCGYKCTTGLLNSKTNQYPSHYTSKRRATYDQHIAEGRVAADCIGLFKSYAWDKDGDIDTVGGKYGSNEHPDKSTKQALAACKVRGDIATIPEIPGLAVWTRSAGHIGVYVGNGEVIELKGYSDNCQWNKLAERTFTTWGLYPYVEYTAEQVALAKAAAGMDVLRKGDRGDDVEELQKLLVEAGYDVGKRKDGTPMIDGIFGSETLSAVRAYQHDHGLNPTGVVDAKTWAEMSKEQGKEEETDEKVQEPSEKAWESMTLEEKVEDLHKWRLSLARGGESNG